MLVYFIGFGLLCFWFGLFLYVLYAKLFPKNKVDLSGIYVTFEIQSFKFKSKFMAATLTDTEKLPGTLQTVNKKGQPTPVEDGTVDYSSSNEAVFTVTEDPNDETKFTVVGVGAGTAQLNYSADADRGEGVVTITGFTDITVTPAQATGFNVTFGTPEEQ